MMQTAHDAPPPKPVVWLVIGEKLGDNAQIKMIADHLGLPYEIRRLLPKRRYVRGKPRFKISLDHLDPERSDALQPPWPDLIITAGRRHSMAALWIKAQSPRTKIVLLGRPRRWIEKFDLVITLPQYQLPRLDNVMRLSLPLMRADKDAVEKAGRHWAEEFESLKKPVIAIFVGGPTQPYRFNHKIARKLVSECAALHPAPGGSLYFVTSPRTTAEIANTLKTHLPTRARLHLWKKDDTENRYLALLGLADACVVTGDSVSMMIEVADLSKPLAIFPLPTRVQGRIWQAITRYLYLNEGHGLFARGFTRLGTTLYKTGIMGFPRDLSRIHRTLIDKGLATYLGDGFSTPKTRLPSELNDVRRRIFDLVGKPSSQQHDVSVFSDIDR